MAETWLDRELPTVKEIRRRLAKIIPGGQDPQGWARRELAAKTIFVMLYGYAVEGYDRWIRPTAVTDMTDAQAARQDPSIRRDWLGTVQGRHRPRNISGRWFSENTREPIRDETLRALVEIGVVLERSGLPTTSPKPRYALSRGFADLLSPALFGPDLDRAIEAWQEKHLSPAALARLVLLRKRAGARSKRVLIRLPNGETRSLAPGPSSELTRAAVEDFAPRFLREPAVVAISESALKLGYRDEELSSAIGLDVDVSKTLPDLILADLGAEPPLVVFVECVVTDGPITEARKRELETLAAAGGYRTGDCVFVTVFRDRAQSQYRRLAASLAWGTFVWFATEPEHVIHLREGAKRRATTLAELVTLSPGR